MGSYRMLNKKSEKNITRTPCVAAFFRFLVTLSCFMFLITHGISCSSEKDKKLEAEQKKPNLTIAINAGEEGKAIGMLVREYPHGSVSVAELPYTNLREKLTVTLSANRPAYDVVMLDDPWFPELGPYLRELEPLPQELVDDIIPASLALGRLPYPSGKIHAIPYVGNCQLLFYRKDLLANAGIKEPPNTWEGVIKSAKAVRESDSSIGGYTIRGKAGAPIVSDFLPVLWSFGGGIFKERGNPQKVTINSSATKKALQAYKQLARLSPPGAEAFDWSEMTTAFTSGRSALQLNWPAAVVTIDAAIPPNEDGERRWGVAMPPSGQTGKRGTSMAGNWLLGVPNGSQNAKAATKLILWLLEQQGEAALVGNPPTRRSVYESISNKKIKALFHYPVLRQALENSTPRPRTHRWSTVEDIISEQVSAVITDRKDIDTAVQQMDEKIKLIFN